MSGSREFDLLDTPLEGVNLIEASAGTGKTYALTAVYLRLLLECGLQVPQILVVTFTKAATNELNERIRKVLHQARQMFAAGAEPQEPFLRELRQRFNGNENAAADTLHRALEEFDQAAIYTIDAFCHRVLQEQTFESGAPFDAELVPEQSDLLLLVVQDFWRKRVYRESALFVTYLQQKRLDPDALFNLVEETLRHPEARLLPEITPPDTAKLEEAFASSYAKVRQLWWDEREEICERLRENPALKRNLYKSESVAGWFNGMDAYLTPPVPHLTRFKPFEYFTRSKLDQSTKKGQEPPDHDFFKACEAHWQNLTRLEEALEQRRLALEREAVEFARTELRRRKRERNVYYFDDLLLNVYEALQQKGETLTQAVRGTYGAALIDEFQDTDPLQYEIFRRLFDHAGGRLFLIGDPKQAIYGFRGADVFAYMRARRAIANRYTLTRNYRSTAELLDAFNALFRNSERRPFIYEDIPYEPARAPDPPRAVPLQVAGDPDAPFRLWFVEADQLREEDEKNNYLNVEASNRLVIGATVAEITRLLALARTGRARLGDRALQERDLAVLVRKNDQAQQMQQALAAAGVHSVLYSSTSVFHSREAEDLQHILTAVAHPRNLRLLKAALATETLGLTARELFELEQDDRALEGWLDKFAHYHQLWRERGFVPMFAELLRREELPARLMRLPDGERRATNLLHLAEVLNEAAAQNRLGMTALLKWFAQHRAAEKLADEKHQLRLESDAHAVKIVTMHMSKGLQYPVVFCPFAWAGASLRQATTYTFHAEEEDWAYHVDLARTDESKPHALKEALAEQLRLMYVAVTRAQNRCYFIWGKLGQGWRQSAPTYLFCHAHDLDWQDLVQSLSKRLAKSRDADLRPHLEQLARAARGAVRVESLPVEPAVPLAPVSEDRRELTARPFTARVASGRRISSYTALVSRQAHAEEVGDYDVWPATEPAPAAEPSTEREPFSHVLHLPRGAKTGRFLHDLFQTLDFTQTEGAELEALVRRKLALYGLEPEWSPAVCDMVRNVVGVSLPADPSFALQNVPRAACLSELEFYFPFQRLSVASLQQVFARHAAELPAGFLERLSELTFAGMQGYMKGFIDLVFEHGGKFYVVDWKSNFLGAEAARYARPELERAMVDHLYVLQYHIYAVALSQYLRRRLPDFDFEKHFGGVFYLFVRGVDAGVGSERGVYDARPSSSLVQSLAEI